jgi:hypothetical protein
VATVRDLIRDALFACEALGQDESVSAADSQLGMRILQRMLDTWSNRNLAVYATATSTITTTGGTASYATSSWSPTTRPVSIQNVYVRQNGVDEPVTVVPQEVYDSVPYKSAQGLPEIAFYKPSASAGTIYLYPIPDSAYTVYVNGRFPLAASIGLDTEITLPPGYEAAIVSNLAIKLCPYFGVKNVSPALQQEAFESYDAIARLNFVPPVLQHNFPGVVSGQPGYIRILGDT